jgi:hypothetical protein
MAEEKGLNSVWKLVKVTAIAAQNKMWSAAGGM